MHHHHHGECGHSNHTHTEDCGCHGEHVEILPVKGLSALQQNMLLALYERSYLPLAQFTMTSTKDEELYAIALAPVYLGSVDDTMEQVKALGAELWALERHGLITLDYDIPLKGYAYQEYESSALYKYFQETVKEGGANPEALFDTAILEKGSMALTESGEKLVREMIEASQA